MIVCALQPRSPGTGGQTLNSPPQGISAAPGGPGPEVLFGPFGRTRLIRATSGYSGMSWSISGGSSSGSVQASPVETRVDVVTITEYTGAPARACDGSTRNGDPVIEYEHRNSENGWTARARQRTPMEVMTPRWSVSVPAAPARGIPAISDYGLAFTFDPAIDLKPPEGVPRPDCIE